MRGIDLTRVTTPLGGIAAIWRLHAKAKMSDCFRELDRIAKIRYLEKLKLLGLDKTDNSFQLFVTRSNRSGKLIIGADATSGHLASREREGCLLLQQIMARVQGSFLPNMHAYSSRVTSQKWGKLLTVTDRAHSISHNRT